MSVVDIVQSPPFKQYPLHSEESNNRENDCLFENYRVLPGGVVSVVVLVVVDGPV